MGKEKKTVYEIRKDGEIKAASHMPRLGYSARLLRQMAADGYRYYIEGKPQRRIEE